MAKSSIFGLILVLSCLNVSAATWFVDFAGGNDANAGTAQGTAWKHCPGDSNATGTAAGTTPAAGDIILFKGGVSYNGQIHPGYGGSSLANPVTFMSAEATWGTGRAINDGYFGGATNASAFLPGFPGGSSFVTISGFEIKNQQVAGVQVYNCSSLIVTNCLIHHIGDWPNDGINYNGHGYGVKWDNGSVMICVSNAMYDCNETAVYPNGGAGAGGGLIVWGNTISNVQDHAFIAVPANGYQLIAFNSIHDQTNGLSHDDNIHTQGFYRDSGAMIFCGNKVWNGNQDFFVNTLTDSGDCYVFNNVLTQTLSSDGTGGYGNGIVINVNQAQGWSNICVFNNTIMFKNTASGGRRIANRQIAPYAAGTNFYFVNNILYQSYYDGKPDPTNVVNYFSGYNANTNVAFGNSIPASDVNSVYGKITFANLIQLDPQNSDLHLVSGQSIGLGQGTNVSNIFPANKFSFLPARYQVDPTKDAAGVQRGTTWDIGAYAGAGTPPPGRIAKVTNLHAKTTKIGP